LKRERPATRTRTPLALWAPVLAAVLACSKSDASAVGDAGAPHGVASAVPGGPSANPGGELAQEMSEAPPARIKLLDAGQSPRRTLRYAWRTGQRETLVMDLRTSASTEEGSAKQPEIELPPVHIVLAIDPREISPAGDLSYAWRVTSTAVSPDAQTPAALTDGMRAEVAAVAHLSGTAVVTSSGISTRISIDPEQWHEVDAEASRTTDAEASRTTDAEASRTTGAHASPTADAQTSPATDVPRFDDAAAAAGVTGQMVEQVRQTLRDVAAPFPEEEVGPGARWEKLSQLASRDARVTQTEVFTLTQITATTGALDDVLAQTAPPQPLLSPGGPPGAQARIESMLASGDGKTQFDLTRLVPQTRFGGTTTMVVSSRSRDEADRTMTMVMRVDIVLAGTVQ
jgi:hypothetical protein